MFGIHLYDFTPIKFKVMDEDLVYDDFIAESSLRADLLLDEEGHLELPLLKKEQPAGKLYGKYRVRPMFK